MNVPCIPEVGREFDVAVHLYMCNRFAVYSLTIEQKSYNFSAGIKSTPANLFTCTAMFHLCRSVTAIQVPIATEIFQYISQIVLHSGPPIYLYTDDNEVFYFSSFINMHFKTFLKVCFWLANSSQLAVVCYPFRFSRPSIAQAAKNKMIYTVVWYVILSLLIAGDVLQWSYFWREGNFGEQHQPIDMR